MKIIGSKLHITAKDWIRISQQMGLIPELPQEKYLNVPHVNLSLHGTELHIEGPEGSTNLQLTEGQLNQLKVDFEHMLGGN